VFTIFVRLWFREEPEAVKNILISDWVDGAVATFIG
jgi:hypothetical protein